VLAFADLGSKPTTLAGYGITDAQSSTLADGKILVGNASNVATAVTMSGDATLSNAGALTLATVPISKGGTGVTSFTADKVVTTSGAGAIQTTSCGLNQVISFTAGGAITCADVGISGTTGKIAKFTSSTTVGDSLLTESTGQVAVTGQINSTGNTDQTTNSPNINFNYGNSLFVTASCTAFALSNMVSGGNYSFAVQGNSGTCSFTHGADTIHYAGGVSNVTITSHTIFGFVKYGTHVYVTWVTF
jgi:hypothetical protein